MPKRVRDTAGTRADLEAAGPSTRAQAEARIDDMYAGAASPPRLSEPEPSASAPELSESDKVRELLRSLRVRRAKLADELGAVEFELYRAIRGARAAGVPKQVIAKEAGVARQTVYNVLARDNGE